MKYRNRFNRNKTRVIRVSIAAYVVLKQVAEENGITIAEVVYLLLNKAETDTFWRRLTLWLRGLFKRGRGNHAQSKHT